MAPTESLSSPSLPGSRPHLSPNQRAWQRFKRNRPAMISLWFLLVLLTLIFLWPLLSPNRPDALSDAQFQGPSLQHCCGTDVHGRDLLARLMSGARISLLVGALGA